MKVAVHNPTDVEIARARRQGKRPPHKMGTLFNVDFKTAGIDQAVVSASLDFR